MKSFLWKYSALNKVFFLFFFVLGQLYMVAWAWGQVSYLPDRYQLKLDKQGNIPPKFWSYEIPFKPVTQTMTFIDIAVDLTKQEPVDPSGDDEYNNSPEWKKDKNFLDGIIQVLDQGGVTLKAGGLYPPPEQAVGSFSVSQIGKNGLYLWSADGQSFLVNPMKHSQVVPLYFNRNSDDWGKHIASADAQLLSSNVYRVFCNLSAPSNGCGAAISQWLSIVDVDFNHGTLVQIDLPNISWATDLHRDGNIEVVISAGVDDMVVFPWVYAWDGTKWVDRRATFWNCYRNGMLKPWAFCNSGGMSKVPEALDKAIEAGEPLKYWKVTTSMQK